MAAGLRHCFVYGNSRPSIEAPNPKAFVLVARRQRGLEMQHKQYFLDARHQVFLSEQLYRYSRSITIIYNARVNPTSKEQTKRQESELPASLDMKFLSWIQYTIVNSCLKINYTGSAGQLVCFLKFSQLHWVVVYCGAEKMRAI